MTDCAIKAGQMLGKKRKFRSFFELTEKYTSLLRFLLLPCRLALLPLKACSMPGGCPQADVAVADHALMRDKCKEKRNLIWVLWNIKLFIVHTALQTYQKPDNFFFFRVFRDYTFSFFFFFLQINIYKICTKNIFCS